MKKVYLILLWLWLAMPAMAQQSTVFQGTYNSGQHTIYHSSLVTDTVNPTIVSQDAKVELRAATSIRLLPGFRAGGFTPGNGGYFLASIGLGGSRKDTAICKGQQIQLGDSTELNVSYAWSPSIGLNDTTLSNPLANPDSTTMYLLLKTYPNGRVEIDTVVVLVNPLPVANAGSDVAFCAGGSVGLSTSASGGTPSYSYAWSPSTGLSSATMANPTASPSATTTYTVTVTDSKGCSANDGVVVLLKNLGSSFECPIDLGNIDTLLTNYSVSPNQNALWFRFGSFSNRKLVIAKNKTFDSQYLKIDTIQVFSTINGYMELLYIDTIFNNVDSFLSLNIDTNQYSQYLLKVSFNEASSMSNKIAFLEIKSVECTCGGDPQPIVVAGTHPGYVRIIASTTDCINASQEANYLTYLSIIITCEDPNIVPIGQQNSSMDMASLNINVPSNQISAGQAGVPFSDEEVGRGILCPGQTYYLSYTEHSSGDEINGISCAGPTNVISFVMPGSIPVLSANINVPDTYICLGQSINLSAVANGGCGNISYSWNNGLGDGGSKIVSPSQTTTYTVTATQTSSCGVFISSANASITINVVTCYNCSYPLSSAILTNKNSSQVSINSNETYLIEGYLKIDVNNSVFTGNTFIFLPGSKLEVLQGINCSFTNCVLKGCDKQWQGVFCENNAILNINRSKIEDAEYGIKLKNNDLVKLNSVEFNRCYYGIFGIGQNVNPSSVNFNGQVTFDGGGTNGLKPKYVGESNDPNTLLTANTAIYIAYHPGFNVNQNVLMKNSFRGIYSYNTNLTVTRAKFENILKYNYGSNNNGVAVQSEYGNNKWLKVWGFGNSDAATAQFTNCDIGVRSIGTNTQIRWSRMIGIKYAGIIESGINNLLSYIGYNNISSGRFGIRSLFSDNPYVHAIFFNSISIDDINTNQYCSVIPTGIFINNFLNAGNTQINNNTINLWTAKYGIYLNNASKIKVYDNEIIMKDGTATGTGESCPSNVAPNEMNIKYGMYVTNSHNAEIRDNSFSSSFGSSWIFRSHRSFYQSLSNYNLIKCNISDKTAFGFDFMGTNSNTSFKANQLNNHTFGLMIENNSYIGTQPHYGNEWPYDNASDWLFEARNDFYPIGYSFSQFKVHNTSSNYWPLQQYGIVNSSLTNISGSNWFFQSPGTPFSCSEGGGQGLPRSLDASEDSVFHGHLLDSTYNELMSWEATRGLLRRVQQESDLVDSVSGLDTFYTAKMELTSGLFINLEDSIASAYTWNKTDEIADYSTFSDSILNLLAYTDSLMGDTTLADSIFADLFKQHQGYVYQISLADSLAKTLIEQAKGIELDKVSDANSQNSGISVSQVYETNAKTVSDIFLRTIAIGIDTLSTEDKADLEEIIWQCPKSGGHAVYQARALYHLVNDSIIFNDSLFCSNGFSLRREAPISTTNNTLKQAVKMYPNPTDRNVIFQFDLPLENEVNVYVWDITGRMAERFSFGKGTINKQVLLSNCKAGLYFVNISDGSQSIFKEKLVIRQ